VGDLHLNDPECRGVEVGEDYVFSIKTNLSDCGTVMRQTCQPSRFHCPSPVSLPSPGFTALSRFHCPLPVSLPSPGFTALSRFHCPLPVPLPSPGFTALSRFHCPLPVPLPSPGSTALSRFHCPFPVSLPSPGLTALSRFHCPLPVHCPFPVSLPSPGFTALSRFHCPLPVPLPSPGSTALSRFHCPLPVSLPSPGFTALSRFHCPLPVPLPSPDSWCWTPGTRLLVLDSWCWTPGAGLLVSDQSHIMFTNSIQNNESQVISRNYVNITFSCRYPVRYLVQQPGGGHGVHVHLRPGGGGGLVVERAWWWRGPGGREGLVVERAWWWRGPGGGGGLVVERAWWWRGPGGGGGLVVERAWWWRGPGGGGGLVVEGAWTITLNTEDGNFSVSMLLFKDEAFVDRWTTVPSLRLEDHVFVKVFMRCWATPSSDPYSNIQYTFIRDSVQTLSVLRNGEGPDAAFRLQMFKFVGSSYTNVFLHCNIQICSLSSGQCQPNCSSVGEEELIRTRRDAPLSHTVSYGPIRRLLQDGGKPDLSTCGSYESLHLQWGAPCCGTLVLGGLLVLVLLLVSPGSSDGCGTAPEASIQSERLNSPCPTSTPSLRSPPEGGGYLSNIHTLSEVAS
ncbi:hypothetical protein KUCAC02_032378, partial [Chaenocephalus aceratus]